jgi:hypothetical protein
MKTLFKQIVSFWVRERGFAVISNPLNNDEVLVYAEFTDDSLKKTILIENRGFAVRISGFNWSKPYYFSSLDEFIGFCAEHGDWEDVSDWEIPTVKWS